MDPHIYLWIAFGIIVISAMAIDLGLHGHSTKPLSLKEALGWTLTWVALAMLFGGGIAYTMGTQRAMEYYTAYLLEESLSLDNMFVFVVIFKFFAIPAGYQHRVLKYGILGAIIMRFIFIFTGVSLVNRFEWLLYVFGAILIYTAIKLVKENPEEMKPGDNPILKVFERFMPISHTLSGDKFFERIKGRLHATPLFAALLVVEASDLLFAIDSIPAVLVVSRDPFIVFTSNVFAIMGLRSLYFMISGVMGLFRYLRYGLCIVLGFIGVKMLISHYYKIPITYSLTVVVTVLTLSILLSIFIKEKKDHPQ